MAKIDQAKLEASILNSPAFTYGALCAVFQADTTMAMQIDRTLQKLRRKKLIGWKRKGQQIIWFAVPKKPAAPTAEL